MYFTDEQMDEMGAALDEERESYVCPTSCQYAEDVGVPGAATPPCPGGYCEHYAPETGVMADLAREHEIATCEHDFDIAAGGGQVMHSGMFEIYDVCVKCGLVRHTGKYDSVL